MRLSFLTVGELKERLNSISNDLCVRPVERNWFEDSGISIFERDKPMGSVDFIEAPLCDIQMKEGE